MPNSFTLEDDEPVSASPESSEILEAMPEPQQHAIDAATQTAEETSNAQPDNGNPASTVDDSVWNPAIHATGRDGKGIRTKSGGWRKRRGKAGQPSQVHTGSSNVVRPEPVADDASARAAGAAAAASVFMLGRAFGGESWSPTADEVKLQSDAWGNYFVAKGVTDFPPGVALTIALASYAGPRFFTPETKQRAGVIKHWFSVRVAKWRVKKELKKRGISAVVSIKGSKSSDVYDSILVDGKPFNEAAAEMNKPK
jgi:hypothetical protein